MKLVAVSLSNGCVQNPPCSFCYQKALGVHRYDDWKIYTALSNLVEENRVQTRTTTKNKIKTICFEYSGLNLSFVFKHAWLATQNGIKLTLTTMPRVVTKTLCGALKGQGVSAIALSYDHEKCSTAEWLGKAKLIKEAGLKVSCNFLLDREPYMVPDEIVKNSDQVNLLSLKPSGRVKNLTAVLVLIESLKAHVPVAVDNCLGVQLGLASSCKAGNDFCHIMPDGKVLACSFPAMCYLRANPPEIRTLPEQT